MDRNYNMTIARNFWLLSMVLACAIAGIVVVFRSHSSSNSIAEVPPNKVIAPIPRPQHNDSSLISDAELNSMFRSSQHAVDMRTYRESLKSPRTWVCMGKNGPVPYKTVKGFLSNDNLPQLYDMFNEPQLAPYWRIVAQLIGYLADHGDPKAVKAVQEFLTRKDQWPADAQKDRGAAFDYGIGKALCLEWLGMIGGPEAETILKQAITRDGAEKLAQAWINEIPAPYPGGKDDLLIRIQGRAAMGLIFTQKPENIKLVEDMYNHELARWSKDTPPTALLGELASAMANQAWISDIGLEARFNFYGDEEYLGAVAKYILRYAPWIPYGLPKTKLDFH